MKFYHIKQNAFFGGLFKIILAVIFYALVFGRAGQSRFRREIATGLISILKAY
jgi:flagellar biogenesis protein FliO